MDGEGYALPLDSNKAFSSKGRIASAQPGLQQVCRS